MVRRPYFALFSARSATSTKNEIAISSISCINGSRAEGERDAQPWSPTCLGFTLAGGPAKRAQSTFKPMLAQAFSGVGAKKAGKLVAASLMTIGATVPAFADMPAGWKDSYNSNPNLTCTVSRESSLGTGIFLRSTVGDDLQMTVYSDKWRVEPGKPVDVLVKVGGVTIDDQWTFESMPDGIRMTWPGMVAMLSDAPTLTIRADGVTLSVDLAGAAEAIRLAQACAARDVLKRTEADIDAIIQGTTRSNAPQSSVPGTSVPKGLAEALQGQNVQMRASFDCNVTARDLFGMPDFSAPNKTTPMGFAIDAQGNLHINGITLEPTHTVLSDDGSGQVEVMAYSAIDIASISSGVPQHIQGIDDESMRGLGDAVEAMVSAMYAGRDRYMAVSLVTNLVQFFDLSPAGQIVNGATANCYRRQ